LIEDKLLEEAIQKATNILWISCYSR